MALLTILEYPDPRLRTKAKPVARVDAGTRRLIDDMLETMYAGGGIGLAAGLVIALFPAAAIGTGLLAGTTAGGAALGAWAGHAAAGMSRHDLKEVGEQLDEGQAAVILVGVADMQAKIDRAMARAEKKEQKQLKADRKAAEKEAEEAEKAAKAGSSG